MRDLQDKVALVTGGASGIGLALARRCVSEGMKTVICDIEDAALATAHSELAAMGGGSVYPRKVDVSDASAVQALADEINNDIGQVFLLFNNAGVGGGGPVWEQSLEDWQWVLGINLMGVVHGIRSFVPGMINNNGGHIVNTASVAGLMSAPGTSTYSVSKHAVVALSEVLCGDLRNAASNVGVSVLCPSFVSTRIYESDRNRQGMSAQAEAASKEAAEFASDFFASAMPADDVASQVFDAIAENRFYVLTHPVGTKEQVARRAADIADDQSPSMSGPHEYPFE